MTSNLVIISVLCYMAILVRETSIAEETPHRYRRQLLYPNSTLFQVNIGLGTPTPSKTINVNWAIQANFQLPWNRSQIPVDILYANGGYDGLSRKRREDVHHENDGHYENDAKLYHFYKYVEDALNSFGHNGTDCVLKTLCQLGAQPLHTDHEDDLLHEISTFILNFGHNGTDCVLKTLCQLGAQPLHTDHEDDLLHEISTFILNPSNDIAEHPCHEATSYVKAFGHGRNHLDCSRMFHCTSLSLLDLFTKTFDTA